MNEAMSDPQAPQATPDNREIQGREKMPSNCINMTPKNGVGCFKSLRFGVVCYETIDN